jgi:hypothetical protein
MAEAKLGIPLAFALALSAAESNAAPVWGDTADLLRPGSLASLLAQESLIGDGTIGGQSQRSATGRIAQWFNGYFNSCIQGYWRRC